MTRFARKFGFIHRSLWQQDGLYRAAVLFGPAPLLGCFIAGAVWAGLILYGNRAPQLPKWAAPQAPDVWSSASGPPHAVEPARPLPPLGTDGIPDGYQGGWRVTSVPIEVGPALDVDVKLTPLNGFLIDEPDVDSSKIVAGGPASTLFVGVGSGFLVAKTAGIYALSVRLERPAGQVANCLVRLGFGSHRITSDLELSLTNQVFKSFDSARFDMQPGLYSIGWAFGCWHDREVTAPGRMVLLIAHPGEPTPRPARYDEIVRPAVQAAAH
jgi:hypothetical protein